MSFRGRGDGANPYAHGANPDVQGWREWDERYTDPVIGKRNWQIAAGGLLILSLIWLAG
jgi:hypothetical protein